MIDIYNAIAKKSCRLKKVDVLPWEVVAIPENVIEELKRMIRELEELGTGTYEMNHHTNVEAFASWPTLSRNIDTISEGKFKGISTIEEERRTL